MHLEVHRWGRHDRGGAVGQLLSGTSVATRYRVGVDFQSCRRTSMGEAGGHNRHGEADVEHFEWP
jgi:hypothetical protein